MQEICRRAAGKGATCNCTPGNHSSAAWARRRSTRSAAPRQIQEVVQLTLRYAPAWLRAIHGTIAGNITRALANVWPITSHSAPIGPIHTARGTSSWRGKFAHRLSIGATWPIHITPARTIHCLRWPRHRGHASHRRACTAAWPSSASANPCSATTPAHPCSTTSTAASSAPSAPSAAATHAAAAPQRASQWKHQHRNDNRHE
jgi:hypothetical protein